MQSEERLERILWKVRHDGRVYTARLAEEYGVSEETVRRDIRALVRASKVKRVHGGATGLYPPSSENAYSVRRLRDAEAKRRIGAYAASLIEDGEILALDGGCCNEQLAKELFSKKGLIFVTNFIPAANALNEKFQQNHIEGRTILLGGEMSCENLVSYGTLTEEMVEKFRFTRAFISASALSDSGAMIWNVGEGKISRIMAEHAASVVLLCESAKFSQTSLYQYIDYSSVDMLVTDDAHGIPSETRARLESEGVEVVILKAESETNE